MSSQSSKSSKRQKSIPFDCWGDIVHYLDYVTGTTILSVVSSDLVRKTAELKRSAKFGRNQLVLADGSIALDRVEAASIRFPALEDVSVDLEDALSDSKGFTDASRAPILAKLCTFTFVTKLDLELQRHRSSSGRDRGADELEGTALDGNRSLTLPASIGRLTALETLHLDNNILTAVPAQSAPSRR